jgi:hypothetical protein
LEKKEKKIGRLFSFACLLFLEFIIFKSNFKRKKIGKRVRALGWRGRGNYGLKLV